MNQTTQPRETLLEFPEKFPIKIFGADTAEFRSAVSEIINTHVKPLDQLSQHSTESSKGNYLAITVTIMAQNQEQLDAIYMDLTSCDMVKMAL